MLMNIVDFFMLYLNHLLMELIRDLLDEISPKILVNILRMEGMN